MADLFNEFDSLIKQEKQATNTSMNFNVGSAANANPEQEVFFKDLSKRTGLPVESLRLDGGKEAKRQALLAEAEMIPSHAPATGTWLARSDGTKVAIAADSFDELAGMERLLHPKSKGGSTLGIASPQDQDFASGVRKNLSTIPRSFEAGQQQSEMGRLGWRRVSGDKSKETADRILQLGSQIEDTTRQADEQGGFIGGILSPTAKIMGQMWSSIPNAATRGLQGTSAGAAAGAIASTPTAGLAAPITAGGGALIGFTAGFGAGLAEDMMIQEGGAAYNELKELRGKNGEQIDETTAQMAAMGVGTVNGLLELVGLNILTAPARKFISVGVKKAAQEEIEKALVRPTVGAAFRKGGMAYATSVGGEVVTEVAQEVTNIVAEEISKAATPGDFDPATMERVGKRLYSIASETFRGTLLLGMPGTGGTFAGHYRAAQKAESNQQFFDTLNEQVKNGKLQKRDVETFEDFVAHVASEQGGIDEVRVPAEQWAEYWQSAGIDPVSIAVEVIGEEGAVQFQEALATGGDVVMPFEKFAGRIVGTDHYEGLKQDLRFGDSWTVREAQYFEQNKDALLDEAIAEHERIMNDPVEASSQAVYENIYGQLSQIMPQDQAHLQSVMASENIRSRATRLGVDPLALYNERPINVGREFADGGGQVLGQGGNISVTDEQDAAYSNAVQSGNKREALRILHETLKVQPKDYTIDRDGAHSPSGPNDGAPLFDVSKNGIYPEDVYASVGRRYYGTGYDKLDNAAYNIIKQYEAHPNKPITVYRAVEKGAPNKIEPGAWVTIVRDYAKEHGEGALNGDYKIVKASVPARDIFTSGDSWLEWGYHPQEFMPEIPKGEAKNKTLRDRVTSLLYQSPAPFGGQEIATTPLAEGITELDVDGTMRPALNSNGKPIHATEEGIRNFWRWFGDSKVVDGQGRPLVVYHGTDVSFDEFDKRKAGKDYGYLGEGFYFTGDTETADAYSDYNAEDGANMQSGQNTMPIYLKIENPYYWPMEKETAGHKKEAQRITGELQAQGHDGVVYHIEDYAGTGDRMPFNEIIAFSPTQIKSATGNIGAFDGGNANILYQSAWHGTPHTFYKFSTSAIGTGEGAQAYGYGLYFAGNKEVAEWYRDKLANANTTLIVDGVPYDNSQQMFADADRVDRLIYDAYNNAGRGYRDKKNVMAELKSRAKGAFKEWKPVFKEAIEKLKSDAVQIETEKGKLYKVELAPAEDEYLLWDKPLSEQSEKVKAALKDNEHLLKRFADIEKRKQIYTRPIEQIKDVSGQELYENIMSANLGSDKAASEYLHSLGIRGIKYLDGMSRSGKKEDYNYVIFSDDDVEIQEMFQRNNNTPRGKVELRPDVFNITLLQNADLTTFTHELGHTWLEQLRADALRADAPEQIKQDWQTIKEWAGIADDAGQIQTEAHETFARGVEAYLMEGKAPSSKLEEVFTRVAEWMKLVYKSLTTLNVELNDEVRGVFDRMLASDEEIKAARQRQQYKPLFATAEEAGMTPEQFDLYVKQNGKAMDAAEKRLRDRLMKQITREREKWWKLELANMKEEVRKEAQEMPVYQATQLLTKGEDFDGNKPDVPVKLDKDTLVKLYGEDYLKKLPRGMLYRGAKDNLSRSMLDDIKAAGGIKYDSIVKALDVNEVRGAKGGNRYLRVTGGKGKGWGIDQMAGMMADQGWQVPTDVDGNIDTDAFAQMLRDAVNGNPPVHPDDASRIAEAQMAEQAEAGVYDDLKAAMAIFDEMFGEETEAPIYTTQNGAHPDDVAALFGYNSGDEMLQAITEAPRLKDYVNQEAERRMQEKHNDLPPIAELADEAVHNDLQAEVLRNEMRILSKAKKQGDAAVRVADQADRAARNEAIDTIPSLEMFRLAAAQAINSKTLREIKPHLYLASEQKAGRKAFDMAAKGKYPEAAEAKRQQLLNHFLYRESLKAQEFADKVYNYTNRMQKKPAQERIGKAQGGYLEQFNGLLEKYEFKQVSDKEIDRRTSLLEWANNKADQGEEVAVSEDILLDQPRNYRMLTMQELQGLYDALKNIDHLAKMQLEMIVDGQAMAYDDAAAMLIGAAETNYKRKALPIDKETQSWVEKQAEKLQTFDASLIKVEQLFTWLDGGRIDGPWQSLIFRPLAQSQTAEMDLSVEYAQKIYSLFDQYTKFQGSGWTGSGMMAKRYFKGIGQDLTKQATLAVALNTGNDGNYQRLLDGYGWNENQLNEILDTLTPEDADFIQNVWDTINEMWPHIEKLEKELTGVAPEKIEPRQVTIAGKTLNGGYYPAVGDPRQSETGERQADAKAERLFGGNYVRATTEKGHTKARVSAASYPIYLNLEVIPQHMAQVMHDLAYRRNVLQVNKLLNRYDVAAAIKETMGVPYHRLLNKWLANVANDANIDRAGADFWMRFMAKLRTNSQIVSMGFKASTMTSQISGFLTSMDLVKPKYLMHAVQQTMRNPMAMTKAVREKSGEMRHRANMLDRDVRDGVRKAMGKKDSWHGMQAMAFHGIAIADAMVSVPTWWGAYQQGLAEGMDESAATAFADRAVRLSQGAGGAKDLSAVQQKSEFTKLITMFYSYFNVLYSRFRDMGVTAQMTPAGFATIAWRSLILWVIPAVLSEMLAGRMPPGDDEDERNKWFAKKILAYPFMVIPFVRDVVNSIESGRDYVLSPITTVGQKVVKLARQADDISSGTVESDKLLLDIIDVFGYSVGAPTGQAKITGRYLWELWNGEVEPDNAGQLMHDLLFTRERKQ